MSSAQSPSEQWPTRLIKVQQSDVITIGRASRPSNGNEVHTAVRQATINNAYFNERTLSADHAKISRLESSNKFVLWDSGSQHGVVFKGKLLPKGVRVAINSNDTIGLVYDTKNKALRSKTAELEQDKQKVNLGQINDVSNSCDLPSDWINADLNNTKVWLKFVIKPSFTQNSNFVCLTRINMSGKPQKSQNSLRFILNDPLESELVENEEDALKESVVKPLVVNPADDELFIHSKDHGDEVINANADDSDADEEENNYDIFDNRFGSDDDDYEVFGSDDGANKSVSDTTSDKSLEQTLFNGDSESDSSQEYGLESDSDVDLMVDEKTMSIRKNDDLEAEEHTLTAKPVIDLDEYQANEAEVDEVLASAAEPVDSDSDSDNDNFNDNNNDNNNDNDNDGDENSSHVFEESAFIGKSNPVWEVDEGSVEVANDQQDSEQKSQLKHQENHSLNSESDTAVTETLVSKSDPDDWFRETGLGPDSEQSSLSTSFSDNFTAESPATFAGEDDSNNKMVVQINFKKRSRSVMEFDDEQEETGKEKFVGPDIKKGRKVFLKERKSLIKGVGIGLVAGSVFGTVATFSTLAALGEHYLRN